jgi:hypothetical protein
VAVHSNVSHPTLDVSSAALHDCEHTQGGGENGVEAPERPGPGRVPALELVERHRIGPDILSGKIYAGSAVAPSAAYL